MPTGPCQVGPDEPDARLALARMPLDLGHDAAGFVPTLRPKREAGVIPAHFVWWSSDGALEQVGDPLLQNPIGRQSDRVARTLGFEERVHLGVGEGGVAPEAEAPYGAPVAGNHRLKNSAPVGGAVHVARPQGAALARQGSAAGSATLSQSGPPWLAGAAEPAIAWSPTTQRIAGSWHNRSASFTSS
jgi:hypothetical protein